MTSSSFSETAPSPCEPRTYERSLYTGEEDLATPPGPLVANDPADDAIVHHDGTMDCGWIEPDGKTCNQRIDYNCKGHFVTAHGIRNMSWRVRIKCRWCPPSAKKMKRKGFIRHLEGKGEETNPNFLLLPGSYKVKLFGSWVYMHRREVHEEMAPKVLRTKAPILMDLTYRLCFYHILTGLKFDP